MSIGVAVKSWTDLFWPFRLDISVCNSGHNEIQNSYIEASPNGDQTEPANVTSGMEQLGVKSSVSHFDEHRSLTLDGSFRDILEQQRKELWPVLTFYFGLSDQITRIIEPLTRLWYYYTALATCEWDTFLGVHESRVDLLHRTVRETASLALAMQSVSHTAITEEYYRYLPYFTNDSLLTTTFATPAIQPTRIRGYIVVMVTLGLYTLITLLTIFMLVGFNNWRYIADSIVQSSQAYAQVWTLRDAADEELFGDAKATKGTTVQTDAAVQKDFKKQQRLDKQVFALEEDDDGHRMFRRREYKTPKD